MWPGRPFPLGATWEGEGTNFSLFSEHAERVELCLFAPDGAEIRHVLPRRTAFNWHGFLPGVGPGERYGYRVYGPYAPERGSPLQPGEAADRPVCQGDRGRDRLGRRPACSPTHSIRMAPDGEDDSAAIPRSVVVDPSFDWEGDDLLRTPWHETVIYEAHVKGITARHPGVREDLRGTYAGLASDEAIAYLKLLGVTAVELLPIHHIADEAFLHEKGLSNYWGYSSIGYFAPHSAYAATGARGQQVAEFKGMVKALHRAGIEVILDVVYNHTAEGDHRGPILAFRGIDNPAYYRLDPNDPSRYVDFTGTGNSLNPVHPSVLRMIMDSLRYFVIDCHVDGFRFDLASALAREFYDVDRLSAFFDTIHQDPGAVAGQADRRAVGSRAGRLPGRELPGALDRVERLLSRHDARLLARADERGGVRVALHRLERPLPGRRPPSLGVDQLHHGPRRLHARRPRLVQREAQRGEPRGQPRRAGRQPVVELRRRGADGRSRGERPARAASNGTSSRRCSCRRGCR